MRFRVGKVRVDTVLLQIEVGGWCVGDVSQPLLDAAGGKEDPCEQTDSDTEALRETLRDAQCNGGLAGYQTEAKSSKFAVVQVCVKIGNDEAC